MLASGPLQHVVSYCLRLLNSYPASAGLYILACLCPGELAVLELLRLDLSQPHQHKQRSETSVRPKSNSCEDLLLHIRAHTIIVPAQDFPHFWLELTKNWLLTCPIDSDCYRDDREIGPEFFCQKLRSELVDRILKLD